MNGDGIKVLLIDSDAAAARETGRELSQSDLAQFELVHIDSAQQALKMLKSWAADVTLLKLPSRAGMWALGELQREAPHVPVIVLTDSEDQQVALDAIREGAQDCLVRGKVDATMLAYELRHVVQRKRAEEALQKSEAFYHSLVESLPQNILRKDLDGRFTFANGRFCNEMGRPLNEIVGRTDFDFFPPALAMKYRADDLRVMESGRALEAIEEHVTPGGEKLYVQVIKTPVYDASDSLIGTQGIFWDVTEKFRAEEQLRTANTELRTKEEELLRTMAALKASHEQLIQAQLHLIQAEKLESVGRLAAGVAHEVKNPLAIILMGIEYLTETCKEGSAPDGEVMRAMRDSVMRADAIIRGLVDFSAERKLDATDQDLNAMIRQSLMLVKHELVGAHVALQEELAEELPLSRLDPTKIQQVFVNVFMNAIHAMSDGGMLRVRTYVRHPESNGGLGLGQIFEDEEELIVAEVDDTGPGIPPDKLSKVWDPFFTTKGTGRGTGLGLTVTRKIIELHGGEITIANRPEGGARVTVVLKPKGSQSHVQETEEADSRSG